MKATIPGQPDIIYRRCAASRYCLASE